MEVIIVILLLAAVVGITASFMGRCAICYFLLSIFLTPLIGLIALAIAGRVKNDPKPSTHVKCPDCRELVLKDARKCKHCGCMLIPESEAGQRKDVQSKHSASNTTTESSSATNASSEQNAALPERDTWEGLFLEARKPRSTQKNVHFNYIDSSGQSSKRLVSIVQFEGIDEDGMIFGYCHDRKANRSFLYARMSKVVDADTGEVIPNLREHLNREWLKSPEPIVEALKDQHQEMLQILLFMAKADGAMHKPESSLIGQLCRYVMRDERLDDARVHKLLQSLEVPPIGAISRLYQTLKERDPHVAEMTRNTCEKIANRGKTIHPIEKAALELMA